MILEDQKLDALDHNNLGTISAQEKISIDQDTKDNNLHLTCYLCKRNRPAYAGSDEIKRLPKISMSKFVKVLRNDSISKERYLKKLKITHKFIKACTCANVLVHSYCLTAKII